MFLCVRGETYQENHQKNLVQSQEMFVYVFCFSVVFFAPQWQKFTRKRLQISLETLETFSNIKVLIVKQKNLLIRPHRNYKFHEGNLQHS